MDTLGESTRGRESQNRTNPDKIKPHTPRRDVTNFGPTQRPQRTSDQIHEREVGSVHEVRQGGNVRRSSKNRVTEGTGTNLSWGTQPDERRAQGQWCGPCLNVNDATGTGPLTCMLVGLNRREPERQFLHFGDLQAQRFSL